MSTEETKFGNYEFRHKDGRKLETREMTEEEMGEQTWDIWCRLEGVSEWSKWSDVNSEAVVLK